MPLFKSLRDFLAYPKPARGMCMVVSEQEGAEIWIDDKKTPFQTPKMVAVLLNTDTKITLKLTGHETHTAYVKSAHRLSYYHCDLKRIPLRLITNENYEAFSL